VAGQPLLDGGGLVGSEVVADQVHLQVRRDGLVDPARKATGAKPGANVLRPRPTQRDPFRAFAQVRMRDPQLGFAQARSDPRRLLRDEEAAGSNPATPTRSQGLQPTADRLAAGAE